MDKKNILRNQRNFVSVYNRGKSQGSKYVVVLYKSNGLDVNRIAFLASKKVGNSVKRNRARRLMRESYRNIQDRILNGYDIVFVARRGIHESKQQEVQKSMYGALRGASLLRK